MRNAPINIGRTQGFSLHTPVIAMINQDPSTYEILIEAQPALIEGHTSPIVVKTGVDLPSVEPGLILIKPSSYHRYPDLLFVEALESPYLLLSC